MTQDSNAAMPSVLKWPDGRGDVRECRPGRRCWTACRWAAAWSRGCLREAVKFDVLAWVDDVRVGDAGGGGQGQVVRRGAAEPGTDARQGVAGDHGVRRPGTRVVDLADHDVGEGGLYRDKIRGTAVEQVGGGGGGGRGG